MEEPFGGWYIVELVDRVEDRGFVLASKACLTRESHVRFAVCGIEGQGGVNSLLGESK